MTDGLAWPDSPFWTFSLVLYAEPLVKQACLSLQDEEGLDVNLILLAAWMAHAGRRIERALVERLRAVSDRQQTSVMQPLRQARRALNSNTFEKSLEQLIYRQRRALLAVELGLERLEQLQLERLIDQAKTDLDAASGALFLDNFRRLFPGVAASRPDLQQLCSQVASLAPEPPMTPDINGRSLSGKETDD